MKRSCDSSQNEVKYHIKVLPKCISVYMGLTYGTWNIVMNEVSITTPVIYSNKFWIINMKNGRGPYLKLRNCNLAMNAMNHCIFFRHFIISFIDSKVMPMINLFVYIFRIPISNWKKRGNEKEKYSKTN